MFSPFFFPRHPLYPVRGSLKHIVTGWSLKPSVFIMRRNSSSLTSPSPSRSASSIISSRRHARYICASFRGNRDSVLGDECGQQQGWQNLAMKFDEVWQFLWLTPHTLPILWMVAKCCTTNRVVFQPYKWDWTTYRLQDFYGFLPSFHWIGVREILHNLIIYPVPLYIYIYTPPYFYIYI